MDQAFVPDKASKLVVRVKIDSSSEAEIGACEPETEFNPVAVGLFAVVLLIIAGASYYFYTSYSDSIITSSNELVAVDTSTQIASTMKTENTVPVIALDSAKKQISGDANVKLIPPIISDEEKLGETTLTETTAAETEPSVTQIIEVDLQQKQPLIPPPLIEESAIAVKQSRTQISRAPEPSDKQPMQRDVNQSLSVHVSRAHLAFKIKNREPVNIVERVVPVNPNGIEKINFFTELKNLKGQAIRHIWFHNDKQVSSIQFNVRGNRWRVYSSKLLDKSALGRWEVQVVNDAGDLIIKEQFEYK